MTDNPRWFLKEWRQHRGYTQERLAELLGTTKGHLSDIERGVRRYNEDLLVSLALALNTTPADLLRRRPGDPEGIEVVGLQPEQVEIIRQLVDSMRKAS